MDIKLFANLADLADTRVVVIDDDVEEVKDVLARLCDEHPALREALFDSDGSLLSHINVLVDGESIHHEGSGLDTPVESASEIAIFPPVSGG